MGVRGFPPKPTAIRKLEGVPGHRPLATNEPNYPPGIPDRPSGMTAAGRKIWDTYIIEMANAGVLRLVDGCALARLCENAAELNHLKQGMRTMARQIELKARGELKERLKAYRAHPAGKKPTLAQILPAGNGLTAFLMKPEGRRLRNTIGDLEALINVQQREFGLTPSSSTRVQTTGTFAGGAGYMNPIEAALCG